MGEARKAHPRPGAAARFLADRDGGPSAQAFFPSNLPNLVRKPKPAGSPRWSRVAGGGVRLRVEDFFGHQQYGIPSGRPVSEDYHAGDEVLIADGVTTRGEGVGGRQRGPHGDGRVLRDAGGRVEDRVRRAASQERGPRRARGCSRRAGATSASTALTARRATTGGGSTRNGTWPSAGTAGACCPTLPMRPATCPATARAGTRSRTTPSGTRWPGRSPGTSSTAMARTLLGFTWSIFNEPDLWILFWHASWDDLQTYYDYTTDAILRAFEDRGYDSEKVFIGGPRARGRSSERT